MSATVKHVEGLLAERLEKDVLEPMADFQDPNQEWRRLLSELYGTFLRRLGRRHAEAAQPARPHELAALPSILSIAAPIVVALVAPEHADRWLAAWRR